MKSKSLRLFGYVRGAAALLVAFLVALALIFLSTDEPLTALRYMLLGPAASWSKICRVLAYMIPITFTGLGTCIMFSANQFNLAGEGCISAGGFVGALVAIYCPMPTVLHQIVCILAGALIGGLIMLIPGFLKTKWGVSEMVVSLMLNYIILDVTMQFLTQNFADRSQGATMTFPYKSTAIIPKIFEGEQVSYGIFIALAMAVLCWFFLYRTRWGYAIRMVGINKEFSQYSGIKVGAIVILCQVVGGILAGMGGVVTQLGYFSQYRWTALTGYGWDGITLAILAGNNPILIPIAAFFVAYLQYGCELMNTWTTVPVEMMDLISVVIFLFFAADQFLSGFRQKLVVRETQKELAEKAVQAGRKGGEEHV